ncbi:hypothetical protein V1477_001622 [Vespula maculifrons]|uniref:Uncharacterized protein n=1 Tax=Vespula maculifrons TaxID=7453 RepID=A0ABD2CYD5_VESMC
MNDIIIKTEPFTIKIECVLRELRCALVDIQKETNKIIVKVNKSRIYSYYTKPMIAKRKFRSIKIN